MEDIEIEVPTFFLCPISLEIMKDPVTLSTGITYDRQSIEKWLYSGKNTTCPVTKQLITDSDLTPNHTLRRFIQSWCMLNASYGIERIPTPKPLITQAQIVKILNEGAKSPQNQVKCLRRLQSIAAENASNKRCMEAAGAVDFLTATILNSKLVADTDATSEELALSILYNLQVSESGLKNILRKNGEFVDSLTRVMQSGSYEARAYSAMLLASLTEVADQIQIIQLKPHTFSEVIRILKDKISSQATKAVLQLLINTCPHGRNRVKAVESGGVTVLTNLLLDCSEKRACEMMMTVLEMLCGCAEGRAELLAHPAGIVVVSKKILRVSQVVSEKAVRILYAVAKFSGSPVVVQEMLQLGVVAKLCLVLQVECGSKIKEKAREVLKLHARVWKNSPCVPTNFISSIS